MQAHQVLRDFASRAEEQVLQALAAGWRSVDPESVMSSSHLSSEQTLAWNLMKPGASFPTACPAYAQATSILPLEHAVQAGKQSLDGGSMVAVPLDLLQVLSRSQQP